MTNLKEALKSVQFVIDSQGNRTGALLNMATWEALLDWLEAQEDQEILEQSLEELTQAGGRPEQAGWLDWQTARSHWDD
ncbi:MAG: hypothetical protein HC769_02960 [Cyanobacteria bacterium CRU_2_1]|nr:hypothetical protein [Cyanobacteria bacterium RU_5_0]NJR57896.1 hypothetical protein [Cyanobacteria bacterium CRU_2_1]